MNPTVAWIGLVAAVCVPVDARVTQDDAGRARSSGAATPREYFEARKAAILAGDVEAFWRGVKKRPLEELVPLPDFAKQMREDPERTKQALAMLGLDKKDPAKITREDLFLAELKREFARTREMALLEVKEEGDRAVLRIWVKRVDETKEESLSLVREGGVWLEDAIGQAIDAAKLRTCKHLIVNLMQAARSYQFEFDAYPPTGNVNLVKALKTLAPKKLFYFEFTAGMLNDKGEVLDPWGRPLVYINNTDGKGPKDWKPRHSHSFDLYSFGPDGKDDKGEGDDPNNWE